MLVAARQQVGKRALWNLGEHCTDRRLHPDDVGGHRSQDQEGHAAASEERGRQVAEFGQRNPDVVQPGRLGQLLKRHQHGDRRRGQDVDCANQERAVENRPREAAPRVTCLLYVGRSNLGTCDGEEQPGERREVLQVECGLHRVPRETRSRLECPEGERSKRDDDQRADQCERPLADPVRQVRKNAHAPSAQVGRCEADRDAEHGKKHSCGFEDVLTAHCERYANRQTAEHRLQVHEVRDEVRPRAHERPGWPEATLHVAVDPTLLVGRVRSELRKNQRERQEVEKSDQDPRRNRGQPELDQVVDDIREPEGRDDDDHAHRHHRHLA